MSEADQPFMTKKEDATEESRRKKKRGNVRARLHRAIATVETECGCETDTLTAARAQGSLGVFTSVFFPVPATNHDRRVCGFIFDSKFRPTSGVFRGGRGHVIERRSGAVKAQHTRAIKSVRQDEANEVPPRPAARDR